MLISAFNLSHDEVNLLDFDIPFMFLLFSPNVILIAPHASYQSRIKC